MRRTVIRMLVPLAAGATALALAGPAAADHGATVVRFAPAGPAYTYNDALVPVDARAVVTSTETSDGRTIVTLRVQGLVPDRTYGAHAHYLPCGSSGGAAGAHYQYVMDPAVAGSLTTASTDADYANPANEIWLDLHTNPAGNGVGRAVVDWQVTSPGAQSVVIHTRHTSHGDDGFAAGSAGARLACVSFTF